MMKAMSVLFFCAALQNPPTRLDAEWSTWSKKSMKELTANFLNCFFKLFVSQPCKNNRNINNNLWQQLGPKPTSEVTEKVKTFADLVHS